MTGEDPTSLSPAACWQGGRYDEHMFDDLAVSDDAALAHHQTVAFLISLGYHVQLEVEIRVEGRNGRIDLVATKGDEVLAVELDRRSPRKKSLVKLEHYPATRRMVLLRGGDQHYMVGRVEVLSLPLARPR